MEDIDEPDNRYRCWLLRGKLEPRQRLERPLLWVEKYVFSIFHFVRLVAVVGGRSIGDLNWRIGNRPIYIVLLNFLLVSDSSLKK